VKRERPRTVGNYQCLGCGHRWSEPLRGPELCCPRCSGLYIKWLNYEKLRRERGWQ